VIGRLLGPRALFLAAIVAALLGASRASAQTREDPIGGLKRTHESSQNFALELRVGAFRPDVDSDPDLHGSAPFESAFGSGPTIYFGAEFDWQAYRIPHVGTIGPGLGAGYVNFSAAAKFTNPASGASAVSGENTTLEIFPFYGVIVFRADAIWRELHVPLIPYAKVGIGYALWRASTTLGTASYQGVSGLGHSIGSHVAAGMALALNPFDDYAAKTFDDAAGVNTTSIFAEWTREDLNGLGFQNHPLRVGGTSWTFGFVFEF